MATQPCDYNGKIIAQTLFLGASVNSFNNSVGWGNQPSQLTVNLTEDITPCPYTLDQFGRSLLSKSKLEDNHYHTCYGSDCYVVANKYSESQGEDFDPKKHSPDQAMVPGKVYYAMNPKFSYPLVSRYWFKQDPGFIGRKTRIRPDGRLESKENISYQYDIIDTPVFFKMGNFSFCGLVQSWNRNLSSSGQSYSVNIYSMQSLLNSCYIIIDKYAGSIFTYNNSDGTALYGSPKNFLGPYPGTESLVHEGHIGRGNIPNVFNVYGFLESLGINNFGVAKNNERGMSANKIVDAIHILTSSIKIDSAGNATHFHDLDKIIQSGYARKTAFSPFGRIVTKHAQLDAKSIIKDNGSLEIDQNSLYQTISDDFTDGIYDQAYGIHGIVAPKKFTYSNIPDINYTCDFLLDLSELPRTPDDFRIQGPVISIMDLINTLAEQTGQDVYIDTVPTVLNNQILYVIKVKTVSRLSQPRPNNIENTIKEFECNNLRIVSNTVGKEKNETNGRSIIVGGSQQRLYQVKSYRLAYTQANFIYDDRSGKFIDYVRLGRIDNITRDNGSDSIFDHGKIKMPNFFSTRNKLLSSKSAYSAIIDDEDDIQKIVEGVDFTTNDELWSDHSQTGGTRSDRITGNYKKSKIVRQTTDPAFGLISNQRWFPIQYDTICPFFGFVYEEEINLKPDNNGDFRRIRPVWLDTWSGQLAVIVELPELPEISVTLSPLSGQNFFLITESEIRAALAGFDNFMVYSLAKLYKPDLIEMLRRSYINKTIAQLVAQGETVVKATEVAQQKHNWYWNTAGSNIGIEADGDPKPAFLAADIGDGSSYMAEDAVKDLQILHKFVADVGKNYGKKYMVTADKLQTYKDEDYAGIYLETQVGPALVFNGAGSLTYNYQPTNDGAWEEYGNFIDDSIVVGGPYWYVLSDDNGKIKPIVGYNANYYFDYLRYSNCLRQTQDINNYRSEERLSEYWDFDTYLSLMESRSIECNNNNFIFPMLDISSLGTDYVITDVITTDPNASTIKSVTSNTVGAIGIPDTRVAAYNAHGYAMPFLNKTKLYVNSSVEENFVYLDPVNLNYPKIIIDAPGVALNHSNNKQVQDPSRTIMANVSIEDLVLYMRTTISTNWDTDWMSYQLSQTKSIVQNLNGIDEILLGLYGNKTNQSALMAEIAPKMAHPFFVAIPIKSNQFTYGPWTNYPYLEYRANPENIFPNGQIIVQTGEFPLTCSKQTVSIDSNNALYAINNWITPVSIEFKDDFVPWFYGGSNALDNIAYKEIETKINYQTIIESAQVEMVGLPAFNLGGNFAYGNLGVGQSYKTSFVLYNYTDIKNDNDSIPAWEFSSSFALSLNNTAPVTVPIVYNIYKINSLIPVTVGPIITNIQTGMSPQGIATTYSFRTYTRKLGLFNKEQSDRVKRNFSENFKRNRQLASLSREMQNIAVQQRKFIDDQRLDKAQFGTNDYKSKLFGWSPVKVLIGKSTVHMKEPNRNPKIVDDFEIASDPGSLNTAKSSPSGWSIGSSSDTGMSSESRTLPSVSEGPATSISTLSQSARITTDVGLYDQKEINAQIENEYGLHSAMSLDGLLSPISYYPTLKNGTFSFSKYDTLLCPFCNGTKIRLLKLSVYYKEGNPGGGSSTQKTNPIKIYCDKCVTISEKLNAKLKSSSSTVAKEKLPPYIISSLSDFNTLLNFKSSSSGSVSKIPINLVTLNPIVGPYGEFKNSNSQNYAGAHPDGIHGNLPVASGRPGYKRSFRDRLRHSIEIVARGAVPPGKYQYGMKTSQNLTKPNPPGVQSHNQDYYNKDLILQYYQQLLEKRPVEARENNQRFFGLRGPLMLHGWGYDTDGYPIPNAADEPFAIDEFGRKKRFKIKYTFPFGYSKSTTGEGESAKTTENGGAKYKDMVFGQAFIVPVIQKTVNKTTSPNGIPVTKTSTNESLPPEPVQIFSLTFNNELLPEGNVRITTTIDSSDPDKPPTTTTQTDIVELTPESTVFPVIVEDDYTDEGGFDPSIYKGNIISKTQKYENGRWTQKIKLNEFHLHWAERSDLWPVGPIDLRWDNDRKVWTMPQSSIYKFVYITLEEDLVRENDFIETYPARGFLDDIEYNKDNIGIGNRRVVYVKDRSGYTAPKGVKLLCRYDSDSGFYEPISKPSIITSGFTQQGNRIATIFMNYVQGRQSGQIPQMTISYEDRLGLNPGSNKAGMFTYVGGTWVLTAVQP